MTGLSLSNRLISSSSKLHWATLGRGKLVLTGAFWRHVTALSTLLVVHNKLVARSYSPACKTLVKKVLLQSS